MRPGRSSNTLCGLQNTAVRIGLIVAVLAVLAAPSHAASLTEAEAELRARQLDEISYRVELALDPTKAIDPALFKVGALLFPQKT